MLDILLKTIQSGTVTTSQHLAYKLGVSEELVKSQLEYLKNMGYVGADEESNPEQGRMGCSKNCHGCALAN